MRQNGAGQTGVLNLGEIVSEFVRNMRKLKRLSQRELAARSKVAQTTISAIENGGRTYRGVHLEKILTAFDMTGHEAIIAMNLIADRMAAEAAAVSPIESTKRGVVKKRA